MKLQYLHAVELWGYRGFICATCGLWCRRGPLAERCGGPCPLRRSRTCDPAMLQSSQRLPRTECMALGRKRDTSDHGSCVGDDEACRATCRRVRTVEAMASTLVRRRSRGNVCRICEPLQHRIQSYTFRKRLTRSANNMWRPDAMAADVRGAATAHEHANLPVSR